MSTPLCRAANDNDLNLVEQFIAEDGGATLNVKNSYDMAPLHYAVDNKNLAMVNALINAGANLDIINNIRGSPLYRSNCWRFGDS